MYEASHSPSSWTLPATIELVNLGKRPLSSTRFPSWTKSLSRPSISLGTGRHVEITTIRGSPLRDHQIGTKKHGGTGAKALSPIWMTGSQCEFCWGRQEHGTLGKYFLNKSLDRLANPRRKSVKGMCLKSDLDPKNRFRCSFWVA